jgi:c-di-GMP-binding flagellar brake protein YcgR
MAQNYKGVERREFFRYNCDKPIQYKVIRTAEGERGASDFIKGMSKNLSASGMMFTASFIPDISSLVTLKLDYRTTNICCEIEENALIFGDVLIGKVVRIEENDDGTYNIGVAFLKKTGEVPADLKSLAI